MLKKVLSYLLILFVALMFALSFQIFVLPNQFAPSGLNGICTMIQYLFDFKLGYLYLILNIPLALMVYFLVSKPQAIRSMVFTVGFSVFVLLLDEVDLSAFRYATENGTSLILGPLVGGLLAGVCSGLMYSVNALGGGTEFVASVIQKYRPNVNFFWVAFVLNAIVALASYFVYGYEIEPVLLSIIYCYTSSLVRDKMLQSSTRAIRCEIITRDPEALSKELQQGLHHGVTLIPARGMYAGKDTNVLLCIINKSQVAALKKIIKKHPDCFATFGNVDAVLGNFSRLDSHGNPEKQYVDDGLS